MSDETVNPEAKAEKVEAAEIHAEAESTVPEAVSKPEVEAHAEAAPAAEATTEPAIETPAVPKESPVAAEAAPEQTPTVAESAPEQTPVAADAAAEQSPTIAVQEPAAEDAKPASKSRAKAAKVVEEEAPVVPAEPDNIDFGAKKDPVRGRRKVRTGRVVSSKMEKTVVVAVESRKRHPLYGKFMRHTSKFKAHDEANTCGEGDTVEIMETRPISKEKRWRVVRIIERAK